MNCPAVSPDSFFPHVLGGSFSQDQPLERQVFTQSIRQKAARTSPSMIIYEVASKVPQERIRGFRRMASFLL